MKTPISRRLLARSSLSILPELSPSCRVSTRCIRPFSQSSRRTAIDDNDASPPPKRAPQFPSLAGLGLSTSSSSLHPKSGAKPLGLADTFKDLVDSNSSARLQRTKQLNLDYVSSDGGFLPTREEVEREPHRLHVNATRHNTHITVTGPKGCKILKPDLRSNKEFNGGVLISVSAGNIGFKKSGRKHYDSAFQLASYVMTRMQEAGVSADIQKLEVFFRGFGAGREAVTKALLGSEGRFLRMKVVSVSDATRLKFGGTRSKKPRRLG